LGGGCLVVGGGGGGGGGGGKPLTQPHGVTCLNAFAVLMCRSGQRLNSLNDVTDGSCKLLQITIILLRILHY
jgi:hypothetical protein